MTDRPIIFSAPMVRALLDGRKTQTRRVLKPQPGEQDSVFCDGGDFWHVTDSQGAHISQLRVPYAPGDRLYVREAWAGWMIAPSIPLIGGTVRDTSIVYRADETDKEWSNLLHDRRMIRQSHGDRQNPPGNWVVKPSIHMPRRISRLTLTVTDVRAQRLQEIREADAVAEGIEPYSGLDPDCHGFMNYQTKSEDGYWLSATDSFRTLWNSLHGPDAWAANPWVCAISFTTQHGNIDQIGGAA